MSPRGDAREHIFKKNIFAFDLCLPAVVFLSSSPAFFPSNENEQNKISLTLCSWLIRTHEIDALKLDQQPLKHVISRFSLAKLYQLAWVTCTFGPARRRRKSRRPRARVCACRPARDRRRGTPASTDCRTKTSKICWTFSRETTLIWLVSIRGWFRTSTTGD